MKNKKIILFLAAAILFAGVSLFFVFSGSFDKTSGENTAETWYCPMHPDVVTNEPGDCPVCGMTLVKMENENPKINNEKQKKEKQKQERHPKKDKSEETWYCPMHPDYITDRPGDCPICGMALVKLEKEEKQAASKGEIDTHAKIHIGDAVSQSMGITTQKVEKRGLSAQITTYGTVAYDPGLYTAINEYIQTLRSYEDIKNSEFEQVKNNTRALVRDSRTKLKLIGLSDEQIRKIGTGSVSPENLLFGKEKVWVYAEIYEYESGLVKKGQGIKVTSRAFPGHVFTGKITAVDPVVSRMTGTLKIRAEVSNSGGLLKPGMFVITHINIPIGKKLSIDKNAVVNTGERNIVFLKTSGTEYTPVIITTGRETSRYYEVLAGLEPGDEVAASGTFLMDSESRIKATMKMKTENRKMKVDEKVQTHNH